MIRLAALETDYGAAKEYAALAVQNADSITRPSVLLEEASLLLNIGNPEDRATALGALARAAELLKSNQSPAAADLKANVLSLWLSALPTTGACPTARDLMDQLGRILKEPGIRPPTRDFVKMRVNDLATAQNCSLDVSALSK